jgi:hypothetical protein
MDSVDDKTKKEIDLDSLKAELGGDILNGDADEILEPPEDEEIDIDDLKP